MYSLLMPHSLLIFSPPPPPPPPPTVKNSIIHPPSAAYMRQWTSPALVQVMAIGIDTKIEVIVVSPTTWEAHHSPRAKPEGCGELPRSLVTPQWPKSRYQFRFYHDAPKHIKFMQIRVCISRKSLIKLLQISHHGKHGHRPLSQQLP